VRPRRTTSARSAGALSREQITALTGYKRSTRDAYVQRLRTAGLAKVRGDRLVEATEAGVAALGDYEPLPTGVALQEWWLSRLPGGEAKVLRSLIDRWPDGLSRDEVTDETGYQRSTRDAYIQRLRTKKIVTVEGSVVYAGGALFGD